MLQRIARLALRFPRRILAIAAVLTVAAAIFGIPVANHLSAGGFQDPGSESASAARLLSAKFNQSEQLLLITVDDPADYLREHELLTLARLHLARARTGAGDLAPVAALLDRQISAVISRSRRKTLAEVDGRSLPVRLRDGVARLFSPYL